MIPKTSLTARRELIILLVCFAGSFILHVAGIILHHAPVRELVTKLYAVLLVTLILYGVVIILRVLYYLISRYWIRK